MFDLNTNNNITTHKSLDSDVSTAHKLTGDTGQRDDEIHMDRYYQKGREIYIYVFCDDCTTRGMNSKPNNIIKQ